MKYYYREHNTGYQRVKTEGKTSWAQLFSSTSFDDFSSRAFLEMILPMLNFSVSTPLALEYGCGTGPGACFLAERGFKVDGIDIIPIAIEIAKEQSKIRNLDINYMVQDICQLSHEGRKYDIIVDSYCLQGIVTDADREKLFSVVRARLKSAGYYLISTAMFDENRLCEDTLILDSKSNIVYNKYGEDLIDLRSNIVYTRLDENPEHYEGVIKIRDQFYILNRRHLKPRALRAELEGAKFDVLYQDRGNVVCIQKDSFTTLITE